MNLRHPLTLRPDRVLAVSTCAAVGVAFAAPLDAAADEAPLGCGAVVTSDVRLVADLLDCPGSGLVVDAPGVTIDLAGHVVDGSGFGTGIDNEAGHDGVRIVDGTVRDFQFGIHLFETVGARVAGVTARDNVIGAAIHRSAHVELERVAAVGNSFNGVDITFSDEVTVRRSTASDNGHGGIVDRFSSASRFERNTVSGNVSAGLTVDWTERAVVERNVASGNDFDGFHLTNLDGARVVRNEAVGNTENGIFLDQPGNRVARNVAVANQRFGIAAPDGTIDGGHNEARDNLEGDCTGVVCG
jgi:parallel beta-helix repeat protein